MIRSSQTYQKRSIEESCITMTSVLKDNRPFDERLLSTETSRVRKRNRGPSVEWFHTPFSNIYWDPLGSFDSVLDSLVLDYLFPSITKVCPSFRREEYDRDLSIMSHLVRYPPTFLWISRGWENSYYRLSVNFWT